MWILGLFLLLCSLPSLEAQRVSSTSAETPESPPPQPIPFSHKVHLKLGLNCLTCHTIAAPGFEAGLPPDSQCMLCHASIKKESPAIQKLAAHEASGKPLKWARIYTLPRFVWFSHQSHHQDAGLACEQCHGPVSERDLIVKEKPTSMGFCMDCHAQRDAPNGCDFCHNLQ